MTELKIVPYRIPAADVGPESTLPAIGEIRAAESVPSFRLDEDDGLFIGYGLLQTSYPYRAQDNYTRDLKPTEYVAAVLENDFLRATFLPDLGGRLWSLYDKKAGRELTFCNPVVQPANLAIRNAWLSGGVEWNCGMVGHHPFTCSQLCTARTHLEDGTPVLRMYEYERIRSVVYQMDFFLPEGSPLLYCRMRIVNPNPHVTPMYWWSNIAVPEAAGSRVVMDATDTYTNRGGHVTKQPVPFCEGKDITYPVNNGHSVDFFWHVPDEKRKFVCQLDRGGYGLIQTSTRRLQGRKLFVWGQGPGGDRWQSFLTAPGSDGRYVEIQAGLAHTQYECLPMPPRTAWEWMEGYGALSADPAKVHGEWAGAVREVSERLNGLAEEETLETMLRETRAMAVSPAEEILLPGSAWGTLENARRAAAGEEPICPHLTFAPIGEEQKPWADLLETGELPAGDPLRAPGSYISGDDWEARVRKAPENWYTRLVLALIAFAKRDFRTAKDELLRSEELCPSMYAKYLRAQFARIENDPVRCARFELSAAKDDPTDVSMAKEAARALLAAGMNAELDEFWHALPKATAAIGRVRLCYGFAALRLGRVDEAAAILADFEKDIIPDIREGEVSITEFWYEVQEAEAKREGKTFDRESVDPPAVLDFRMFAERRKK